MLRIDGTSSGDRPHPTLPCLMQELEESILRMGSCPGERSQLLWSGFREGQREARAVSGEEGGVRVSSTGLAWLLAPAAR